MGSTNLGTESEVRRRLHARDVLANALPTSPDISSGKTARNRRGGGNTRSSGSGRHMVQTTTSRGHVIVPPYKARVIEVEVEQVPRSRSPVISNSNELNSRNEDEFVNTHYSETKSPIEDQKTTFKSTFVKSFCKAAGEQSYNGIHDDVVNNNNITMKDDDDFVAEENKNIANDNTNTVIFSQSKEDTSLPRDVMIDRSRSSFSSVPIKGNVTGSKNKVSSHIAALREEYVEKKRGRTEFPEENKQIGGSKIQDGSSTDLANKSLARRRRDRQNNIQTGTSNVRRSSEDPADMPRRMLERVRKSEPTLSGFGHGDTNRRKHPSYLPTHIQPLAEERASYKTSPNSISRNSKSVLSSQQHRKLSVNRFDSSSSSSSSMSSSSDSENDSPNRQINRKTAADDLALRSRRMHTETPDTSDAEKPRPGGRRRRPRRLRNENKSNEYAATQPGRVVDEERKVTRMDGGFRRRNRHDNIIPMLEDKYVTLPDNYTHSEFTTKKDFKKSPDEKQATHGSSNTESKRTRRQQTHGRVQSSASFRNAGGRNQLISDTATSSYTDKQKNSSSSNADKLIISSGKQASQFPEKSDRSVGQASSPSDKSHIEDRSTAESGISKHVDLSDSSPDLSKARHNSAHSISGKPVEQQANFASRAASRNNSTEAKVLGNIRSIFENFEAPKKDFGHSYIKKEQNSQGGNVNRATISNAQDSLDNGAVESQPMLSARKIGEDYWPRDEATERLLSRKTTSTTLTKPDTKSDYEITMQETIDQLHKFADDQTPVQKSKSRSNSMVGLSDISRHSESESNSSKVPAEVIQVGSTPLDTNAQTDTLKQSNYVRRSSNNRPALLNLSKVQMVKISPLDLSPCMSSTETLKDCSSGEYQGRNSRSHSIDSIASNPETILLNASLLKDRNHHLSKELVYKEQQDNSDLFIVETCENLEDLSQASHINKDVGLLKKMHPTSPAGDLSPSSKSSQKSMIMQVKELTASLKKFKLAGPPQPLVNSMANWQKATSKTDPILSVSPRGNVTRFPPNLEPVCEHPEPPSPDMNSKKYSNTPSVTDISPIYSSSKLKNMHDKEESLDIDEGIVTEEEVTEDPLSYLKLEEKLDELNKRRKRSSTSGQKDSDGSNGNESNRSLSDPMPTRKRSVTGEKSIDSNLLGSLQAGKAKQIPHIGSFDQQSTSSLSVFSEHRSLYGDSPVSEDLQNETPMLEESACKTQVKPGKKKSLSDPYPEGLVSHGFHADAEVIQEADFQGVYSASSEPNVTEQTDKLGDLDQFKKYANKTKMSKSVEQTTETDSQEEPNLMSPRNVRRNVSMKARLRAENVAGQAGDSSSIIGKLLASKNPQYNPRYQYQNMEDGSPSSTPGASTESSPVRKQTQDTLETEEQQFFRMYASMTGDTEVEDLTDKLPLHSRSNSEPVESKSSSIDNLKDFQQLQNKINRGRRPGIIQAPSLESVGNRYDVPQPRRSNSEKSNSPKYSPPHHTQSMDTVFASPQPTKREKFGFTSPQGIGKHDMRLHVVKNLLETEESYVASLQILFEDYMKPLKHPDYHSTCEPRLVDEMFHKIPQLLQHHEKFCENVQECYQNWNYRDVQLGDLFLNSFNKDALLETYTSYIKNYLNAREAVRTAMLAKMSFKIFIEQCQRENKDKQGLADLMIKPVQRIPRYELIIKDLLKHTPEGHQDRAGLLIAQREIHTLAEQMNRSEKEAEAADTHARLLQDIEQIIEGCIDLCMPKRRFLRQDIIAELKGGNKKDRSLWLFNDLIICTTAKKGRTASLRRSSMNLWSMGQDRLAIDFANKYKFLWKFPLEDVEHLKGNTAPARLTADKQLQVLQNDCEILNNIHRLSIELSCNHLQLDESLKELLNHVNRQISEKKQLSFQSLCPPGRVELGISTGDGVKTFMFEFPSEDNKVQFERLFANAKRSLTTQKNRWEPTFMKAIPISKTRAGMQFSCAAPNVDLSPEVREVWVCNTDGYVGQVCFLSLESEPTQTQCITVCHAKICCIAQVPTWERRLVPASTLLQEMSKGPLGQPNNNRRHSSSTSNPALAIMSWDDQDESDEDNTSPISTMSNYSSYSVSPYSTNNSTSNYDDDLSIPAMSPLVTSAFLRHQFSFSHMDRHLSASQPSIPSQGRHEPPDLSSLAGFIGSKMDPNSLGFREGAAWKKDSDGSTLHGSLEDLLGDGGVVSGSAQGILAGKDSMWLGTEDGKINIYPSSESIRGTKHCVRLAHSAAVHCILYHEGQVFVALSNGDLIIYFRNVTTGEWDFENQKTKSKVSTPHAITKMIIVGQKELWCGCQNQIKIIDTTEHTENDHFSVTQDNKRQIYCMVCCGYGVWVALDKRPQIKLFHTVSHDLLADIDVSSPVSKMLASADAIIRQHKAACLRITALLVCKDLLWVGTSAGVVLTLALPKITTNTTSLPLPVIPQGLAYGHTGHVRFLTSVETSDKEQNSLSRGSSRRASSGGNKRRASTTAGAANQSRTNTLIISGGDGYEDFRMNSTSESAGREDSTNHLLVWRA